MLALASTGSRGEVVLRDAAEPEPLPSEALVSARAVSVNRGEAMALALHEPGTVVGWDVAGVVERPAADGSGPPAGTRVVGLVWSGGWAERVPISTRQLAQLPDEVSFEAAATLPVAGLTALHALQVAGFALGKRLLVTGASGGVGRFAVQLAQLGGAHVTGVSSSCERARGLRELGADAVIHELTPDGEQFDAILDGVGGRSLGAAMQRIAPYGTVVAYASSDERDVSFPSSSFRNQAGARVYALRIPEELERERSGSRDLARLAGLLAAGRLVAPIDVRGSWREAGPVLAALLERRVAGKAVLAID
ncbi:MAG TPA: zinc-binding dehydrogenase [Conexibacter sp.]|nr:zinc-binding dehydrogenase [Conexibacter sp.]